MWLLMYPAWRGPWASFICITGPLLTSMTILQKAAKIFRGHEFGTCVGSSMQLLLNIKYSNELRIWGRPTQWTQPALRKKVEPKRPFWKGDLFFSLIIMFRNKTALPAKVALFFKIAPLDGLFSKKGWKQLPFFQKDTILVPLWHCSHPTPFPTFF